MSSVQPPNSSCWSLCTRPSHVFMVVKPMLSRYSECVLTIGSASWSGPRPLLYAKISMKRRGLEFQRLSESERQERALKRRWHLNQASDKIWVALRFPRSQSHARPSKRTQPWGTGEDQTMMTPWARMRPWTSSCLAQGKAGTHRHSIGTRVRVRGVVDGRTDEHSSPLKLYTQSY